MGKYILNSLAGFYLIKLTLAHYVLITYIPGIRIHNYYVTRGNPPRVPVQNIVTRRLVQWLYTGTSCGRYYLKVHTKETIRKTENSFQDNNLADQGVCNSCWKCVYAKRARLRVYVK